MQRLLLFAESDLEIARKGKFSAKVRYEMLCFHAQQAVEKAIKAVIIYNKSDYPKTHDIEFLLSQLSKKGIEVPALISESKYLSQYATSSRYPDDDLMIDRKEYLEAVKSAVLVVKWAKSVVNKDSDKLF